MLARAIYGRLTATTDGGSSNPLKDAVGSRIYAIEAPASASLPLVLYALDDPDVTRFFSGKTRLNATFTVSVFHKGDVGPDVVAAIEGHAFDLLDDQTVTASGFDRGVIHSVARGAVTPDGDYLRSDSTFQIVATAS